MKSTLARICHRTLAAAALLAGMSHTVWAFGPPGPPNITAVPSVPVGGAGVTVATTLAIAIYGIWRSRR